MSALVFSKVAALLVMFVTALFFGLITIKVRHFFLSRSSVSQGFAKKGLSACLCFGAGVLFATVFLHILPEAKEGFDNAMASGEIKKTVYPIAELTFCAGFFLIYLFEELGHLFTHDHPLGRTHHDTGATGNEISATQNVTTVTKDHPVPNGDLNHDTSYETKTLGVQPDIETSTDSTVISIPHEEEAIESTIFRSIMVVSALSIHGCFEGLALGLEESVFDVWCFCLAICLHKIVIAFSIGLELLEVGIKPYLFYTYMIGFSFAAPVGAFTGIILYNHVCAKEDFGTVAIAILMAISGGTILFVVFCEVLERERAKPEGKIIRFLALTFGFIAMACLQMVSEEKHNGESKPKDINFTLHVSTEGSLPSGLYYGIP